MGHCATFRIALFVVAALAAPAVARAEGPAVNACGCYRDDAGNCVCTSKKGKCACPGDCEPDGCEAKRAKQEQKEAEAELKRIAEREKKRAAEAKKASKKRK